MGFYNPNPNTQKPRRRAVIGTTTHLDGDQSFSPSVTDRAYYNAEYQRYQEELRRQAEEMMWHPPLTTDAQRQEQFYDELISKMNALPRESEAQEEQRRQQIRDNSPEAIRQNMAGIAAGDEEDKDDFWEGTGKAAKHALGRLAINIIPRSAEFAAYALDPWDWNWDNFGSSVVGGAIETAGYLNSLSIAAQGKLLGESEAKILAKQLVAEKAFEAGKGITDAVLENTLDPILKYSVGLIAKGGDWVLGDSKETGNWAADWIDADNTAKWAEAVFPTIGDLNQPVAQYGAAEYVALAGQGLENAPGTVAGGIATGFVVKGALKGAVRWAKGAKNARQASQSMATEMATANTSAIAMTNAEGTMSAVSVVKELLTDELAQTLRETGMDGVQAYEEAQRRLKEDPQTQEWAKERVQSDQYKKTISTIQQYNLRNYALNLTLLKPLAGIRSTRAFTSLPTSLKKGITNWAKEGGQEFLEEGNNYIAELAGKSAYYGKTFGTSDVIQSLLSEEALKSQIAGFAGGIGQTALTSAGAGAKRMLTFGESNWKSRKKLGSDEGIRGYFKAMSEFNKMQRMSPAAYESMMEAAADAAEGEQLLATARNSKTPLDATQAKGDIFGHLFKQYASKGMVGALETYLKRAHKHFSETEVDLEKAAEIQAMLEALPAAEQHYNSTRGYSKPLYRNMAEVDKLSYRLAVYQSLSSKANSALFKLQEKLQPLIDQYAADNPNDDAFNAMSVMEKLDYLANKVKYKGIGQEDADQIQSHVEDKTMLTKMIRDTRALLAYKTSNTHQAYLARMEQIARDKEAAKRKEAEKKQAEETNSRVKEAINRAEAEAETASTEAASTEATPAEESAAPAETPQEKTEGTDEEAEIPYTDPTDPEPEDGGGGSDTASSLIDDIKEEVAPDDTDTKEVLDNKKDALNGKEDDDTDEQSAPEEDLIGEDSEGTINIQGPNDPAPETESKDTATAEEESDDDNQAPEGEVEVITPGTQLSLFHEKVEQPVGAEETTDDPVQQDDVPNSDDSERETILKKANNLMQRIWAPMSVATWTFKFPYGTDFFTRELKRIHEWTKKAKVGQELELMFDTGLIAEIMNDLRNNNGQGIAARYGFTFKTPKEKKELIDALVRINSTLKGVHPYLHIKNDLHLLDNLPMVGVDSNGEQIPMATVSEMSTEATFDVYDEAHNKSRLRVTQKAQMDTGMIKAHTATPNSKGVATTPNMVIKLLRDNRRKVAKAQAQRNSQRSRTGTRVFTKVAKVIQGNRVVGQPRSINYHIGEMGAQLGIVFKTSGVKTKDGVSRSQVVTVKLASGKEVTIRNVPDEVVKQNRVLVIRNERGEYELLPVQSRKVSAREADLLKAAWHVMITQGPGAEVVHADASGLTAREVLELHFGFVPKPDKTGNIIIGRSPLSGNITIQGRPPQGMDADAHFSMALDDPENTLEGAYMGMSDSVVSGRKIKKEVTFMGQTYPAGTSMLDIALAAPEGTEPKFTNPTHSLSSPMNNVILSAQVETRKEQKSTKQPTTPTTPTTTQPKQTQVDTREDDLTDEQEEDDDFFFRAAVENPDDSDIITTEQDKEERKRAEKWLNRVFPNLPLVDMEHVRAIVGDKAAFGVFITGSRILKAYKSLGVIAARADATAKTLYHEAWHAFSQLVLTEKEQAEMYKHYPQSTDPEEDAADDFMMWMKSREDRFAKYKPVRKAFEKIREYVIFATQPRTKEAVFYRLATGNNLKLSNKAAGVVKTFFRKHGELTVFQAQQIAALALKTSALDLSNPPLIGNINGVADELITQFERLSKIPELSEYTDLYDKYIDELIKIVDGRTDTALYEQLLTTVSSVTKQKYNGIDADIEEGELEGDAEENTRWGASSTEMDPLKGATTDVLLLLHTLTGASSFKDIDPRTGFPRISPISTVKHKVLNSTTNAVLTSEDENPREALISKKITQLRASGFPELAKLADRLDNNTKAGKATPESVKTGLAVLMNKVKINFFNVVHVVKEGQLDSIRFFSAERGSVSKTQSDWATAMRTESKILVRDGVNRVFKFSKAASSALIGPEGTNFGGFIRKLGGLSANRAYMENGDPEFESLLEELTTHFNAFTSGEITPHMMQAVVQKYAEELGNTPNMFNALLTATEEMAASINAMADPNEKRIWDNRKRPPDFSRIPFFTKVLEVETAFALANTETNIIDTDNKTHYPFTFPSFIHNLLYGASTRRIRNMLKKPYHRSSRWLTAMLQDRDKIQVIEALSFDDGRRQGKTREMNLLDELQMNIVAVMQGFIRMGSFSDKGRAHLFITGVPLVRAVSADADGNATITKEAYETYAQYVADEVMRSLAWRSGRYANVRNYNKNGGTNYLIEDLSVDADETGMSTQLKALRSRIFSGSAITREALLKDPDFVEVTKNALNTVVHKETQQINALAADIRKGRPLIPIGNLDSLGRNAKQTQKNKYPEENQIIPEGMTVNKAEQLVIMQYSINQLFGNIEMQKVFHSDPAFYKSLVDAAKRTPQISADGATPLWKRPFYRAMVIKDESVQSETFAAIRGQLNVAFNAFLDEMGSDMSKEMRAGLFEEMMSKYNGDDTADITDAQAIISVERAEEILEGLNMLTPEQRVLLDKIKKGTATAAEEATLFLQPIKGQYFEHMDHNNITVPVYFKMSEFVLTPRMAKASPQLKALYDKMHPTDTESAQIDEIVFQSGSKSSNLNSATFGEWDSGDVMELPNSGWKMQQVLPTGKYSLKGLVQGASQFKKVIITNMAKVINGMSKGEFLTRLHMMQGELIKRDMRAVDSLGTNVKRSMPLAVKKDTTSVRDMPFMQILLSSKLGSQVRKLIARHKFNGAAFIQSTSLGFVPTTQKEREEAGILMLHDGPLKPFRVDSDGNVHPGDIFLPYRVIRSLPEEVRNDPKKLKEVLIANPELLDGIAYRIPNQSMSMIDNVRIAGILPDYMGDTVMVYPEMTAKMGSDFDIDKLYVHLPNVYWNGTKLEQVPYTFDEHDIEANRAMYEYSAKWPEINPSGLKYSTINDLVQAFIRQKAGSGDSLPDGASIAEMLDEAGYDISEAFRTFLTEELTAQQIESLTIHSLSNKKLIEFYNDVARTRSISFDEFMAKPLLERISTKGIENAIMDMHKAIMRDKSSVIQVIKPTDSNYLKDLSRGINWATTTEEERKAMRRNFSDRLESAQRNSWYFTGISQLAIKRNNIMAKDGVGAVANMITFQAWVQNTKLALTSMWGTTYNMSNPVNKDGYPITWIYDLFLSAFVDAARDPFIIQAGVTINTFPAISAMVQSGLSLEDIMAFARAAKHTQKYFDNNSFGKEAGKAKTALRKRWIGEGEYDLRMKKYADNPGLVAQISNKALRDQVSVAVMSEWLRFGGDLTNIILTTKADVSGFGKNIPIGQKWRSSLASLVMPVLSPYAPETVEELIALFEGPVIDVDSAVDTYRSDPEILKLFLIQGDDGQYRLNHLGHATLHALKGLKEAEALTPMYHPTLTASISQVLYQMNIAINPENMEKVLQAVYGMMMGHLMPAKTAEEVQDLFNSDKSVASRWNAIRNEYPTLKSLLSVQHSLGGTNIDLIVMDNFKSMSEEIQLDAMNEMRDMLAHPEHRSIAQDMIYADWYVHGNLFNKHTISHIIPVEWYREMGIDTINDAITAEVRNDLFEGQYDMVDYLLANVDEFGMEVNRLTADNKPVTIETVTEGGVTYGIVEDSIGAQDENASMWLNIAAPTGVLFRDRRNNVFMTTNARATVEINGKSKTGLVVILRSQAPKTVEGVKFKEPILGFTIFGDKTLSAGILRKANAATQTGGQFAAYIDKLNALLNDELDQNATC